MHTTDGQTVAYSKLLGTLTGRIALAKLARVMAPFEVHWLTSSGASGFGSDDGVANHQRGDSGGIPRLGEP